MKGEGTNISEESLPIVFSGKIGSPANEKKSPRARRSRKSGSKAIEGGPNREGEHSLKERGIRAARGLGRRGARGKIPALKGSFEKRLIS